jgi:phosphoadenosine phosphosulfate reductase
MEVIDRRLASSSALDRKVASALRDIASFADAGPCYASTSWGKDSTVLVHLVATLGMDIPVVSMRWPEVDNPDSALVRDAMLARFPHLDYREFSEPVAWCHEACDWLGPSGLDYFRPVREAMGDRRISGIRADESRARKMRLARWGVATQHTCAPLSRWTGPDVFAYLSRHDLPVHPAYACTWGGTLDRERVRVDIIGGVTGTGRDRMDWERRYYPDEVASQDRMKQGVRHVTPKKSMTRRKSC